MDYSVYAPAFQEDFDFCDNPGCGHVFPTLGGLHYHQRSCHCKRKICQVVEGTGTNSSRTDSLEDCKQQRKLTLSVSCQKLHNEVSFSFYMKDIDD